VQDDRDALTPKNLHSNHADTLKMQMWNLWQLE